MEENKKDEINKKYPKRNNHYYIKNNGVDYELPAVTEILSVIAKPQLITWAARVAAKVALAEPYLNEDEVVSKVYGTRNTAANLGKTIHSLINAIVKKAEVNIDDLSEDIQPYAKAFMSFYNEHKPQILYSEQIVYSIDNRYAGTTDMIAKFQNHSTWVIDIKTGKGVYREFSLQLGAYAVAIEEMGLAIVDRTAVLHLKPDASYALIEVKGDLEVFKAVKRLWEWTKNE